MPSNNLDRLTTIIKSLNEFFPSPICARQITAYSKMSRTIIRMTVEFEKAGRRQKKKLKQNLEQLNRESEGLEENCLECIFKAITDDLKQFSEKQIQILSTILPQAVTLIRKVAFPFTPEFEKIEQFIESFTSTQTLVRNQVNDFCKSLLVENKQIIETYSDVISFNQSSYQQTKILTPETLDVMKLEEIMEKISTLILEKKSLSDKLISSLNAVQEKLLHTVHDFLISINEGAKLNLISDIKEYDNIKDLKTKIENADTIEELNHLNREIFRDLGKYGSLLKSEINRLQTEGNNIVASIRSMFPTLSDKWMLKTPENFRSGALVSELVSVYTNMDNWKNQLFEGIKKIASTEELNQIAEDSLQEGLTISNTLLVNIQERATQVQEAQNLEEAFQKIKQYQVYYSEFLKILRDNLQSGLNLGTMDSFSNSMIAIKPPRVNIESDIPSDLFSYIKAINLWKQKLVTVLQESRYIINDTIVLTNQLEKIGIPISLAIKTELADLYSKIQIETEVHQLLNLRQAYDRLNKQFINLTAAYIKDFIKDVTIIQLQGLKDIPKAPFVEDVAGLDLSDLLTRIETIEKWKSQVLDILIRKVDALNFPLIPDDVPVDLRNEKHDILNQMSSSTATQNFIITIKSYFSFLNTITTSKAIMVEETRKQINSMGEMDALSVKYFTEVVSAILNFEIPSDLEILDYSEILELWFRLNTHNKRKLDLIQLKCKEIISDWIKQYKSLPKQYISTFNSLFIVLEQAINEITPSLTSEQTLTRFKFFVDGATSKALESYEKLKALFYNMTIVSIPRIKEVMGELSPEILNVQRFLESTVSLKGQDLASIHRLTLETIHDYEYVLVAKLMELLNISSQSLLTKISHLQSIGIKIQPLIGEQFEIFSQSMLGNNADMMPINMITQSFVELGKIHQNEEFQKALLKIIDDTNITANRILELIKMLGWKNLQNTVLPHVVSINQSRSSIQFWSFDHITNVVIEVKRSLIDLIMSIREIENSNYEDYLAELNNYFLYPYYQVIMKIFEFKLEECSKNIFPLNELLGSRQKLQESEDIEEIYNLLVTISRLKKDWKQEIPIISKWHRVLFLFISDYQPTPVPDEKMIFIANAKRDIDVTYNNPKLKKYLTTAIEYYVSKK